MAQTAHAAGAAGDATVLTAVSDEQLRAEMLRRGLVPLVGQDLLDRYADDAERAVETIEAKIAGMQASLKTAKADAKRLRAEADAGRAE